MKKLKIAMYFSSDPSTLGGVQESVYHLTKALARRGHDISIFGPAKSKRFPNYHRIGRLIHLPMPNGNWSSVNLWSEKDKKPSAIINEGDYDICHIQEPYIPFIAWELIKNAQLPKVTTFHLSWDDDSVANVLKTFLPIMKKSFSLYVDGVLYVSEIARKRWEKLCADNVQQKIILSGLSHELLFPAKNTVNNKQIRILFLARLVSKKGLLFLLEAISKLRKNYPSLKLTVVGTGPERKKYENYVQINNLSQAVLFTGTVSDKKRRQLYQQADIFCAPYVDEGYGITVLEAMACGCAIVGFKNEAFRETLEGYPNPELLVKSRDVNALVQALKKLITDPRLRKKLGVWGIKNSKKYSWDKAAQETEAFYYQIINNVKIG